MTAMDSVRAVANAVLYEGYMLYPYRRSALKNRRSGWSFGTLLPPAYVGSNPGESSVMEAQIIACSALDSIITAEARFLQLSSNSAEKQESEAIERCVQARHAMTELADHAVELPFTFSATPDTNSGLTLDGAIKLRAEDISEGVVKLYVALENRSQSPLTYSDRDQALQQGLIAAHAIVLVEGGKFVSLLDPPTHLRSVAFECRQTGVFPALAGDPADGNAMLVSPIILYDYPQVAPESSGDFFDSLEIDELLTLRVMTLTDVEKQEMLASVRGRELLRRTEASTREDLIRMHGTFRDRASLKGEK